MTDKEKLANIKEQFSYVEDTLTFGITTDTVRWLIQQADKVEKLEMELQIHKDLYDESYMLNTSKNVKIGEHLNKIKRYENALCLLLNYASEYDNDTNIDIITDTFNGFDVIDKYKEEVLEGINILADWLVED